jgi:hypothetical protein|tara:strand:- start:432 stop:725 length:294 start_codon:yes stop_codon:yes gene_type:complete
MSKMAAFKSGFGFDEKEEKKLLPKQFPVDAPLRMHKQYYNEYIGNNFAQEFLQDKGMKVADEYTADSFSEYIKIRGIGKAYGGKVQPRHALGSNEKP